MKISVVTAAWHAAATLGDTMESVLAQRLEKASDGTIGPEKHTDIRVEHIVVDGGSDDGTVEMLKSMEARYSDAGMELRWVSEPDRGIYDAMNKGIGMATGDVVGLLNSDDFYSSPYVLARVAEEFGRRDSGDVDAIYGDVHYVSPENLSRTVRNYSSEGFRRWKMRMGYMPAHPSFYCRKNVYERHGAFDIAFRVAADFENLLRLIYINRISMRYIPMDFVTMRTGGASSSGMSSHRHILHDHLKAYKKNHVRSGLAHESIRYFCKGSAEAWRILLRKLSGKN